VSLDIRIIKYKRVDVFVVSFRFVSFGRPIAEFIK
jgi:hypothetical protein